MYLHTQLHYNEQHYSKSSADIFDEVVDAAQKSKWCHPLRNKINICRFMLLTVHRLTQDDKIEKLAFNSRQERRRRKMQTRT